jgi:hypothetical protein
MQENTISGKWMNKFTGEIINVRDMVIDGDQMIIISNNGTLNMEEFSSNYIQSSDEVYDINGNVLSSTPVSFEEINQNKPKVGNVKLFNDDIQANKESDFILTNNVQNQIENINNTSENYKLIDKLFNKTNFIPEININIKSDNFPKEQLKMLIDIYDISEEEISDYIRNKYIMTKDINESISKFIKKELY